MSSKNIRLIILLMSASFLGIILFQVSWIGQLMEQKQAELDQDLDKALAYFEESLEEREAIAFLTQGVQLSNADKVFTNRKTKFKFTSEVKMGDEDSIINQIGEKFELLSNQSKEKKVIVYGDKDIDIDVISLKDSHQNHIKVVERYTRKRDILNEAVNNIAMEFAFKESSFSERVSQLNIDSLIANSLEREGLQKLDYDYMVKDLQLDSLISGQMIEDSDNKVITKPLLKGFDGNDNGMLKFKLNSQSSYLLSSLWPAIGGTMLLSLMMLFTFIFTIDRIYKQKKLSQMKSDFINNMTHEFKTPISTISLALDAIFHPSNKANQNELEKLGGIIRKENERMHRQVERLLQAARFDKGDFSLDLEPIKLHDLLHELGDLISSAKDGKDIPYIHYELNAKQHTIMADQLHLFNACRNLLDNAIKFSTAKARIELHSYNEGEDLLIEIKDQGVGMSKNTMTHIFDSFYRYTEGDLHQTKGFGLGLAYVKDVIEKLGGEIWVKSKLNEGSTFFLRFKTISNG